tara:strand:+ start:57 stop:803 length:747 start_codon:yes stop_codon:yes gene_type:complete
MSRILVVGDSCKDIFVYCDIDRISPEAPVPVVKPTHKTENNGMAGNVKINIESLGLEVDIITNNNNIKKTRYVDNSSNQMVLRVDENDKCDRISEEQLYELEHNCWGYDAIIISDYCKGFLTEEDIEIICKSNENVFIDTKKKLGDWIKEADFIKINNLEHKKNFEIIPDYPELEDKLIITQGKNGCVYKDKVFPVDEVPVKDVSGAGDTFISALVVEYVKSNNINKAIKFAQKCATIVVQKHGVATV